MSKREIKNQYSALGYVDNSRQARKDRYKWQSEAEKVTIRLIDKLLEVTERQILIRPHPAEDDLSWKNRYQDNRRVKVSKTGESLPAVLGACAVFHTGSTVAFESISCGIPTFSYAPLISTKGVPMITNDLSLSVNGLEQLHNFVSLFSYGESNQINAIYLEQRIFSFGTIQSLKIQSQHIWELGKDLPGDRLGESEILRSHPRRQLNKRIIRFFRSGRSSYIKQHQHKRPVINLARVQNDLKKLNQVMQLNKEFLVTEVSESTFKISPGVDF